MITFFLKKYWIGLLVAALCIVIGCCSEDNFNDGMFLATCLGIMAYFFTLIVFAKRGRTAITMVEGTISFFKFVWYVISLKPLRRWILRTKVVGLNPEPYPFLHHVISSSFLQRLILRSLMVIVVPKKMVMI